MRVVAIDQGTTSTRALVFESDAPPRVAAVYRQQQRYPHAGWVEQDPRDLLHNVTQCLDAAGAADAIGIANQGESCLAWDAVTLQPLSPVIVWQDQRTADAVEQLKASGLAADVASRAGLPLDSYFSASKLAWLLEHSPEVRTARRNGTLQLGTTDTYLLACLTGNAVTDATTASRTSLMNLATLQWDDTLCDAFQVPRELLAPIVATVGPFGSHRGTAIRASIVDQQAALFGHGCRQQGDAKVTFGTGAFALALAGETPPAPGRSGLISTLAWQTESETRYALEGGVYDAGAAIEWAIRIGLLQNVEELTGFEAPAIDRGLVFVPALSGIACPLWSRQMHAAWTGMSTATTRRDLQQSILEGIALQTREVIDALAGAINLGDALSVDGGLSANGYFLQFLADMTGMNIVRSGNTELTAHGCALLAGHDAGAAKPVDSGQRYQPRIGDSDRRQRIERYRDAAQLPEGE